MNKWKAREYTSKYDNYNIAQRLADLKNVTEISCDQGTNDPYMVGMANGLLLAWYTMAEPYGAEVLFMTPEKTPFVDREGEEK